MPRQITHDLAAGIRNPKKAVRKVKRAGSIPFSKVHQTVGRSRFQSDYGVGEDVMLKDWDNLIILDACRYDIFRDIVDSIEYTPDSIISVGSHSEEFIEKTFKGKKFRDTVCVSANGYAAKLASDSFYQFIFTQAASTETENGIHPSWEGMHPKTVYDEAIRAYQDHPNKRLIVHFMQPHNPYFGPRAKELAENLRQQGIKISYRATNYGECEDFKTEFTTLSGAARAGYITMKEFKEIYIENLEFVMEFVKKLIEELEGKTVITADHGELIGESPGFGKFNSIKRIAHNGGVIGHAKYIYTEELRRVPWIVIESGERRMITEAESVESMSIDEEKIEERLRALGYKD